MSSKAYNREVRRARRYLAVLCAHCGKPRGDHGLAWPENGRLRCPGSKVSSFYNQAEEIAKARDSSPTTGIEP